ncbi:type II toxin-antitoxin system Phd/YefM family antitoxin [Kutzneria chonburiensis]|uniref:Antitoxin n=1 Tax=Kutzneria chonburiensis TaxID=1483604 RepID=A0ABV6N5K8_9PSEU|nr:type II toxin-antitoxin system Phd/YefM family antitoxin [Kutzneria chonburiensis]
MPLGDARDHLSEVVSEVQRTHDRVTITRHGHPAAVILAPEDLEGLEETIAILSTPGALLEIQTAQADIDAGDSVSGDDLAAEFLGDR